MRVAGIAIALLLIFSPLAAQTKTTKPKHTMADYTHTGKLDGYRPESDLDGPDTYTVNGGFACTFYDHDVECADVKWDLVVVLEDGKRFFFPTDGSKAASLETIAELPHTYPIKFPYRVEGQKIYVPDTNSDGSVAHEWMLDTHLAMIPAPDQK
jgi:hypothetical protein